MRNFLCLVTLFLGLAWSPLASAQQFHEQLPDDPLPMPGENMADPPPLTDDVPLQPQAGTDNLDDLYAKLRKASNTRYAGTIAQTIWARWSRSGSATIDLMMTWANKAYEDKQYNVALDYLDQVVMRRPDFAEGWNRRATVNYAMDNFAKSMSDIERTLEIEPRHFGALSGMATILERTGNKKAALRAWEQVLAIYPAMESAQDAVIRLSDDLASDAT